MDGYIKLMTTPAIAINFYKKVHTGKQLKNAEKTHRSFR